MEALQAKLVSLDFLETSGGFLRGDFDAPTRSVDVTKLQRGLAQTELAEELRRKRRVPPDLALKEPVDRVVVGIAFSVNSGDE